MRSNLPESNKININHFTNIFKHTTNSYKFYWAFAIVEEIKRGNKHISFKRLVSRMIAKTWYSLIEYRLNLGIQDKLDKIVRYIHSRYDFDKNIKSNELTRNLERINDEELNSKMEFFYKYVPYRLLSPFFKNELRGKDDYLKNGIILELSIKSNKAIYKIDGENNTVEINKNWMEYIQDNIVLIEGWIKFNLIQYLQNRNPNVPAIPFKLEPAYKRKLSKHKKLWREIISISPIKDIYSGDIITSDKNISIDHFIPWSFVLHDRSWNLIPTLRHVNSSKSYQSQKFNKYIDKFSDLQYHSFNFVIENDFNKKIVEDYFVLDGRIDKGIDRPGFKNIIIDNVKPLYNIANNIGFTTWEY